MCHPAPVQLHYLAAGTQTGGSHSLGLFISETLSFWGPKASASTSVRGRGGGGGGGGRGDRDTLSGRRWRWRERAGGEKREKTDKSGREIRGTVELEEQSSGVANGTVK